MLPKNTLRYTTFAGLSILLFGLQVSQRGPAFIDLIDISGTDVEGGSVYITAANLSYMIGSCLAGVLFSRVKISHMTVSVGIIAGGLGVAALPWCAHFVPMLMIFAGTAFFGALFETTINSEEMRICQGNSEVAMQFLSFSYSLGGILGPLIMEPFLSSKRADSGADQDSNDTLVPSGGLDNVSYSFNDSQGNGTTLDTWINASMPVSNETSTPQEEKRIHYAFLITGLLTIATSIPFIVLAFKAKGKAESKQEDSKAGGVTRKLPRKTYLVAISLASMYYFFFTAVDDSFAHYLTYFVVNHLGWTKEKGALVTAVYWGFSTFVKLILIVLASRVKMGIILFCSNVGMIVSLAGFCIVSHSHVDVMVWVFTALTALSVSSIFGGGMAWFDSNVFQMTGKVTATIIIAAAFGCTTVPIPIGVLMKNWSPMAFPYMLLGLAILDLTVIILLMFFVKPYIFRKYGPPRPPVTLDVSPDSGEANGKEDSNGVAMIKSANSDPVSNGTHPVEEGEPELEPEEATQFIGV